MVDVSAKKVTRRKSVAQCDILMSEEAFTLLKEGEIDKGDALKIAEIAGMMAAKKTSDLIPLCHPIGLDYAKMKIELLN